MSKKRKGKNSGNINNKKKSNAARSSVSRDGPSGQSGKKVLEQKNSWQIVEWGFVIAFTLILVLSDSYVNLERKVSDFFTNFPSLSKERSDVVLVKIDEDDFLTRFGGSNPLPPRKVGEVLEAIALGEPKVVGVDIFTADNDRNQYLSKPFDFPVVWASEPVKTNNGTVYKVRYPLAGEILASNERAGAGLLPDSSDGITRFYWRVVGIKGTKYPTFPWQIFNAAAAPDKTQEELITHQTPEQEFYIDFLETEHLLKRLAIPASQILDAKTRGDVGELRGFLQNKIVIFGAEYPDSRDKIYTPTGEVYGIEVIASALETELNGSPKMPVSFLLKIFINTLTILFFVVNFLNGFGIVPFLRAIAAIVVLALVISLIQYNNFSGIPLLVSILFYGLFIALFDLVFDRYKETLKSIIGMSLPKTSENKHR